MYLLYFSSEAQKDAKKLSKSKLKTKIENLLNILSEDPFKNPPPFKSLRGNLKGAYSRRINLQHRLFYEVDILNKRVKIHRMWSHYGDN